MTKVKFFCLIYMLETVEKLMILQRIRRVSLFRSCWFNLAD